MLTLKEVLSRRSVESQQRIEQLAAGGRKEIDAILNSLPPETDLLKGFPSDAEKKQR